jgi:hypothetical protein
MASRCSLPRVADEEHIGIDPQNLIFPALVQIATKVNIAVS